jgi:hypothetical protein
VSQATIPTSTGGDGNATRTRLTITDGYTGIRHTCPYTGDVSYGGLETSQTLSRRSQLEWETLPTLFHHLDPTNEQPSN